MKESEKGSNFRGNLRARRSGEWLMAKQNSFLEATTRLHQGRKTGGLGQEKLKKRSKDKLK